MARIVSSAVLAMLLAISGGYTLWAGEITGKVAVPKPDQVVVYIDNVPGTYPTTHVDMNQQHNAFAPFVLPVVQGSTVEFRNSDSLQHNVMGVGSEKFNLGTFNQGAVRDHTFGSMGDVTLLCNIHPEMEAHVLVLQNPYFTRLDSAGEYHLAKVPAGDYVIKAWYNGKVRKQNVTVPSSGSVNVNF